MDNQKMYEIIDRETYTLAERYLNKKGTSGEQPLISLTCFVQDLIWEWYKFDKKYKDDYTEMVRKLLYANLIKIISEVML